jgi:hypothetical protein
VDTRTDTPVRPSSAERARTVLAAAASASVHWDGGRVDLLGCHHDGPLGEVILTLESTSTLVNATQAAWNRNAAAATPDENLAVTVELTELCPVSVRERVLSRISLGGWLSRSPETGHQSGSDPDHHPGSGARVMTLNIDVTEVMVEADRVRDWVPLEEYRRSQVDPLHGGAAEQLQHLVAHHPDAISTLSRLIGTEALLGVVRVVPIALDRYGIVLRVERLRDHRDVRLPFARPVDSGVGAAIALRQLLIEGGRRRPCGR